MCAFLLALIICDNGMALARCLAYLNIQCLNPAIFFNAKANLFLNYDEMDTATSYHFDFDILHTT